MPNSRRGEVGLTLGGTRYTLCLTLGALAELESALAVPDLVALGERFATGRIASRDLLLLLTVGLRGGGHDLADEEVAALPLHEGIEPVVQGLVELLAATFGGAPPNPQAPQRA
jgi:hypothetical protein